MRCLQAASRLGPDKLLHQAVGILPVCWAAGHPCRQTAWQDSETSLKMQNGVYLRSRLHLDSNNACL